MLPKISFITVRQVFLQGGFFMLIFVYIDITKKKEVRRMDSGGSSKTTSEKGRSKNNNTYEDIPPGHSSWFKL